MNNRLFTDDSRVICAFSQRVCGNMSLCYGDTSGVLENRKKFLSSLGVKYPDLVCAKQVHSNKVWFAKEGDRGKGALDFDSSIPGTDALFTDKKDLPLGIFTADCLPVFLYEPKRRLAGIIHAGWRSSAEDIVGQTFSLIKDNFNLEPGVFYASFGPAIRQCCCGVEESFNQFFPGRVEKRDNSFFLDLVGVNKDRLLDLGLKAERISDCGICTSCCNEDFFSFRREKVECGRMLSVIMLR